MTGAPRFGPDGWLTPGGWPAPGVAHTLVGGTVARPEPCAAAATARIPADVTEPLGCMAAARWKTGSATCPELFAAPGCGDVGTCVVTNGAPLITVAARTPAQAAVAIAFARNGRRHHSSASAADARPTSRASSRLARMRAIRSAGRSGA